MAHRISDHRRHRLSITDVRAMLRLCNELHGAGPDPAVRKRRLLEGVRELTGADHATAAVAIFAGRGRGAAAPPEVLSAVHASTGAAATAVAGGPDGAAWSAYRQFAPPARRGRPGEPPPEYCTTAPASSPGRARAGHRVHSFLPLADGRLVACLTVGRGPNSARFSSRDRSIVCALHAEAAWLYRPDVMHVSRGTRGLSRRELEALQHLLTGKGEKQIATDMRVSYNTLHHYVKSLYRHFGVTSRIELLARSTGN
jgi:DNA-binding CsgD family transcriptional regulator